MDLCKVFFMPCSSPRMLVIMADGHSQVGTAELCAELSLLRLRFAQYRSDVVSRVKCTMMCAIKIEKSAVRLRQQRRSLLQRCTLLVFLTVLT